MDFSHAVQVNPPVLLPGSSPFNSLIEPGCASKALIFGQYVQQVSSFLRVMASTSKTTIAAAAGAVALLSGASFVSAPATSTSHLRATASSAAATPSVQAYGLILFIDGG